MTPSERARHAALVRLQKAKAAGQQKPAAGKPKAPAAPTAEEVAAQTANEIEQAGRGLDKDSLGALQAFAEGGQLDADKASRLVNLGLVEKDRDGNFRATGDGKSVANAARTGNTRQALDALSRASDRMGARAEREASKQAKEAEREAKKREAEEKKQKKGGGGGGGKKDEEKQKAEAEKQKAEAEKQERDELTLALDLWEKNKRGLSLREQVRAIQLGIAKFNNAGNIVRLKPETKAESYTPPQAVQAAARRALEQRADQPPSNRAGTPVGLARARDLANGRSVSMPIVRRMKAFFDRHRGTKPTTQPVKDSKWQQAWGLWGGDAGYRWAQSIVARETKANEPTDPELWAESIREAKKKFRVYPSAYANAWAARRYKAKGGTWRSATKDLREWFAEEWVDISRPKDGGGYEACGRPTQGMTQDEYRSAYPKCLPKARAMKLTEAQRLRLIRRKRRSGLPEDGAPVMTSSETKDLEGVAFDLLDEAIKHGKHNQASHGRRTARRRAYSAAYSQARAGGATPQDAREKAKTAGTERQAERDVRAGRLREAVERRKAAPAPTPAPAPAAPKPPEEFGGAPIIRTMTTRSGQQVPVYGDRAAEARFREQMMREREARQAAREKAKPKPAAKPKAEAAKPAAKPKMTPRQYDIQLVQFSNRREAATRKRDQAETELRNTERRIKELEGRSTRRQSDIQARMDLPALRQQLPTLRAALVSASAEAEQAFTSLRDFYREFGPRPKSGKSLTELELDLLEIEDV
jgi:hypothetical protein